MQEVETTQIAEGLTVDPPVEPTTPAEAQVSGETDAATSEPESVEAASLKFGFTDDPIDLLDHDEVKPHVQRRVDRVITEERAKLTADIDSFKAEVESGQFFKELDGNISGLKQMYEADNTEGSLRALGQLDKLAEKFSPAFQQKLKADGFNEGKEAQLGLVSSAVMNALDERGKDAVLDVFKGDNATWDGVLTFLKDRWATPLKDEIQALKQENEKLKFTINSGTDMNLGSSSGSSKSDDELLADPTTPIQTVMEIRARQKASG
jgi:hypothetical protein